MPEPRPCRQCGGETELRLGRMVNGARMPALQCLTCYEWDVGNVGIKTGYTVEMQDGAPALDRDKRDEMRKMKMEEEQRAYNEEREKRQLERWNRYHEYMSSEKWYELRKKVLERDGYVCQACHSLEATQVHHLSYDHFGEEPMFELVSICRTCHEKITRMDTEKRMKVST